MQLNKQTYEANNRFYLFIVMIGIVLVSINLRPGMTSIGPLMGIIRDDIGLSNWSVGLLTSLPLLAFALISPFVPTLSRRFTNELTMIIGLFVILIGISMRSISVMALLFLGTALVGLGIAICNVLLPSYVKEEFPTKAAFMTSIYSTIMAIFAGLGSGFSVPLAIDLNLGWKLALLFWAIPAFVAMVLWFYLYKRKNGKTNKNVDSIAPEIGAVWKDGLAWDVALFMGLQSVLFYVVASWLPEILLSHDVSRNVAGWLLSYTLVIGLPVSFFVPVIANRLKNQKIIVFLLGLVALLAISGLIYGHSFWIILASVTCMGIVLNSNFALALTLLAFRAKTAEDAAELSAMAQSIGYFLAALGPVFIGYLYDLSHNWAVPLYALIIITCFAVFFGLRASENKFIFKK